MKFAKTLSLLLALAVVLSCFMGVSVGAAEQNWTLVDGVLTITGDMDHYNQPESAPWYESRQSITSVVLIDASHIGSFAFFGCTNLETVVIPETVTVIGSSAFYGCSALTEIELPESVTAIGSHAFHGSGLTFVELPAGITSVEAGVFYQCPLDKIAFNGAAVSIAADAFVDVEATVYYPEDAEWEASDMLGYGGELEWKSYKTSVDLYNGGKKVDTYFDFQEAVDACAQGDYLVLTEDAQVEISLAADLYVDLAGYELSGVITTNGCAVYGMDSTTDSYSAANIGYFTCVDADHRAIVPVKHFLSDVTGTVRRYMAVANENGWSFHRFYLGITLKSLKPSVDGIGYKAVFCADEMVLAELDPNETFGYGLWLDITPAKVVRYKSASQFVTGKTVTLRLENFPVNTFGETVVYAEVYLKLADGTVIDSSDYTCTLREVVEAVANNLSEYKPNQIAAVKDLCNRYEAAVAEWNIDPIRNWAEEIN